MNLVRNTLANATKNVLAFVVGLLATVGLLEGGTRLMATVLGLTPYMQYDETLGWTARPGAVKRHKNAVLGFDAIYEINQQGLRGRQYPKQKHPGAYRIVVLGDSNGFGWGIPEQRHFAALLEKFIEGVEVVNLSLSGYGTDQQYLRLRLEGMAFHPDLVILQVTDNDFDEIQHAFFNQKPKPQFRLTESGGLQLSNVPVRPAGPMAAEFYENSLPLPYKEWLGWNSYAYNLLNEKYYGVKRKYDTRLRTETGRFSPESIALFGALVHQIERTLAEGKVAGLIVSASKEASQRRALVNQALPVLDVWPQFAEYAKLHGREPMFSDGVHWNADGHWIVAKAVSALLTRNGNLRLTVDAAAR